MTNTAKSSSGWVPPDLDTKVYCGVVLLFLRSVLSKLVCLEKGGGEASQETEILREEKNKVFLRIPDSSISLLIVWLIPRRGSSDVCASSPAASAPCPSRSSLPPPGTSNTSFSKAARTSLHLPPWMVQAPTRPTEDQSPATPRRNTSPAQRQTAAHHLPSTSPPPSPSPCTWRSTTWIHSLPLGKGCRCSGSCAERPCQAWPLETFTLKTQAKS